MSVAEVELL